MKEMINKFLDEYLGDEVVCIKGRSTKKYNHYSIYSKKNLVNRMTANDGKQIHSELESQVQY